MPSQTQQPLCLSDCIPSLFHFSSISLPSFPSMLLSHHPSENKLCRKYKDTTFMTIVKMLYESRSRMFSYRKRNRNIHVWVCMYMFQYVSTSLYEYVSMTLYQWICTSLYVRICWNENMYIVCTSFYIEAIHLLERTKEIPMFEYVCSSFYIDAIVSLCTLLYIVILSVISSCDLYLNQKRPLWE